MAIEENRIRSLELAIEEQRRDYDAVNSMYESARGKNYSLIAVGLGLLTYLYTTDSGSLKQRLFIPDEPYGVIIYAISAALFLFGMRTLVMALKSRPWQTAFDNEQDDKLMNNYEEYLECMKKRYIKCSETNGGSYNRKQQLVDEAFWPLVIGGIMLLLLKTFGG